MTTTKDQSAEDILKQLGEDSDDSCDEDVTPSVPAKDPLAEEKKRHKDNLMQDLYDGISDEEEDEEVKSDNPFKEQLKQDAKDLKAKQ